MTLHPPAAINFLVWMEYSKTLPHSYCVMWAGIILYRSWVCSYNYWIHACSALAMSSKYYMDPDIHYFWLLQSSGPLLTMSPDPWREGHVIISYFQTNTSQYPIHFILTNCGYLYESSWTPKWTYDDCWKIHWSVKTKIRTQKKVY